MPVVSPQVFAYALAYALAPAEPAVAESPAETTNSDSVASESVGVASDGVTSAPSAPAVPGVPTGSAVPVAPATATGTAITEPASPELPQAELPKEVSIEGFSSATPTEKSAPKGRAVPAEYGPYYEREAWTEVTSSSDPPVGKPPFLSLGAGAFCFVEAATCRSALIASADVGAGINAVAGDRGVDVPLTQFSIRGGLTVRPVTLLRKRWHPWSVGMVGSFVRSSGAIASTASTMGASNPDLVDVNHTDGIRVALLNQVWLSQKRHALHLDFAVGAVRSTALTSTARVTGAYADVAVGVGGWGALFVAADFASQEDLRLAFGFRGHGIAAAPIAAMVLLGLLAGGGL
ncbi:MAG TPA: hypothetical protein ENK31_05175 [Nannocystis exedens]|nr:hypothetical protein [Nannocystis exedens]